MEVSRGCSDDVTVEVSRGCSLQRYPESEGKQDGTEATSDVHQKLCYHVMGTDQSQDVLCAEWPDNPKWTT